MCLILTIERCLRLRTVHGCSGTTSGRPFRSQIFRAIAPGGKLTSRWTKSSNPFASDGIPIHSFQLPIHGHNFNVYLQAQQTQTRVMRGIGRWVSVDSSQTGDGIAAGLNHSTRTSSSKLSNPLRSGASHFSRVTEHVPEPNSAASYGSAHTD